MTEQKTTLIRIVEAIKRFFRKKPYQIILFGSYAKGTERPCSDIDVAIKAEEKPDLVEWMLLEEFLEESDIPQKIDIVDYMRIDNRFKQIIDQTGIRLD